MDVRQLWKDSFQVPVVCDGAQCSQEDCQVEFHGMVPYQRYVPDTDWNLPLLSRAGRWHVIMYQEPKSQEAEGVLIMPVGIRWLSPPHGFDRAGIDVRTGATR